MSEDGYQLMGGEEKSLRLNYEWGCLWNDIPAGFIFIVHVIGMVVVASTMGTEINFDQPDIGEQFGLMGGCVAVGALGGLLYIKVLDWCASCIIHLIMLSQFLLCAGCAAIAFSYESYPLAVIMSVLACVFLAYYCCVRNRIPFAVELIEISTKIITSAPSQIMIALLCLFFQLLWVATWAFGFLGYLHMCDNDEDMDVSAGSVFGFFISFYWGLEVCRYILYVTAAGVAACWFYQPENNLSTWNAFWRATTTSFGSICLGAFFISIIKALKAMLEAVRMEDQVEVNCAKKMAMCLIGCLLSCLETLMEYFNQFGFVYVAIYGYNYMKSCYRVVQLIKKSGFESMIQFDLTNSALFAGAVVTSLITGLVTGLIAQAGTKEMADNYVSLVFLGMFIGFFFAWIIMQILIAAINTTFVIWAEDPETMRDNRPEESLELFEAAEKFSSHFTPPPAKKSTIQGDNAQVAT